MKLPYFDDNLLVKDALQLYFSRYHFPNGGYHLKWFKIKLGSFYIPLPNTKGRINAVKLHDIHHLITEYEATLKGEAEIAAWEIASGCGKYYIAWLLNFGAFFYGMFIFGSALFDAFMKGRSCKTNLYHNIPYDEILLNKRLGELREATAIHTVVKRSFGDYLLFIVCCLFVLSLVFLFFFSLFALYKLLFYTW